MVPPHTQLALKKERRKRQGLRDREHHPQDHCAMTTPPFKAYRAFLQDVREGRYMKETGPKPPEVLTEYLVDQVGGVASSLGGSADRAQLAEYMRRILRKSRPCCSTLLVALFYLEKVWKELRSRRRSASPTTPAATASSFGRDGRAELITAVMLADKFLFDLPMPNLEWSKVSGAFSNEEVNTFEREFLSLMGFCLEVPEDQFGSLLSFVEASITARAGQAPDTAPFPLTHADFLLLTAPLSPGDGLGQGQGTLSRSSPTPSPFLLFRLTLQYCVSYCSLAATIALSLGAPAAPLLRPPPSPGFSHLISSASSGPLFRAAASAAAMPSSSPPSSSPLYLQGQHQLYLQGQHQHQQRQRHEGPALPAPCDASPQRAVATGLRRCLSEGLDGSSSLASLEVPVLKGAKL